MQKRRTEHMGPTDFFLDSYKFAELCRYDVAS
jgi:hypothetical protein